VNLSDDSPARQPLDAPASARPDPDKENSAMQRPDSTDPREADDALHGGTARAAYQPPPGGRLLTADEAVEILVTGNHPSSARGTLAFDAVLIQALREGWFVACRMPDGQVAFTPVDPDQQKPTSTS
jgi:hypothetical protein